MDFVTEIRAGDKIECSHVKLTDADVLVYRNGSVSKLIPPEWISVLQDSKEKLRLYREAHGGEYVGGTEYTALMRRIDAILANSTQAS